MMKLVIKMYKIIEVKTKKDIKRFINFPLDLYKDCPYYVPILTGDEKKIFKKDFVYNKTCECVFYLCVDENNKVVGRIQGIIQKAANEKWNQKRVRFTRFDSINDQEVANKLFDAVTNWAKQFDINEIVGPLGYSDLEREGLLIDGFDKMQTYEEQYNYDYYQSLIEGYGFTKEIDWLEYKLFPPEEIDPRLELLVSKLKQRHGFFMYQPKNLRKFIKQYKAQFFEIIDTTYNKIYGTVPFTKEMIDSSISNFTLILRPEDLVVIFDKNKKICGFALMFPSIGHIVTKYRGKITLPFLIEFLKNKKNPQVIDLGLIGVLPEYAIQGVASIMILELFKQLKAKPISHLETNLMLENNHNILGLVSNFRKEYTKRRRCFVKTI